MFINKGDYLFDENEKAYLVTKVGTKYIYIEHGYNKYKVEEHYNGAYYREVSEYTSKYFFKFKELQIYLRTKEINNLLNKLNNFRFTKYEYIKDNVVKLEDTTNKITLLINEIKELSND